ncbi:MAG TPA: hypothetical protein VIJ75_07085 [Hanamia sp.]
MKKIITAFLLCALLFPTQNLSAQKNNLQNNKDTTEQAKDIINQHNDSLNTTILEHYNEKLSAMEQFRIADSIKRANLEKEINSLKSNDNERKNELEQQLNELRNQEAIRFTEKKKQIDSLRHSATAYPVFGFFDDTLFYI